MTFRFRGLLAALLFALPACAEVAPFSSELVTMDTALPEEAADLRDDGVLRDETGRPVTHGLLGETFPDILASTVQGASFSTSDISGQWTVLAIWGVWCHDSRNDMGNIADVSRRLDEVDGVEFLSAHVPYSPEHLETMYRGHGSVQAFFEDRGVAFPTILDETGDLRAAMQINWTPTYLVIGPDRVVRGFRTDLSKAADGAVDRFIQDVVELSAVQ